jgi:hypothetical protein
MKKSNTCNDLSSLSRRQWIRSGLTICGSLALGGYALAQSEDTPVPAGYTRPGPVTDLGRTPGMQTRLVTENPGGEKTYAVIFAKGDEVMSGLTAFAVREKLTSGWFTAIGALQSAKFGWFDETRKAFRDITVDHQVELVSLMGDVGARKRSAGNPRTRLGRALRRPVARRASPGSRRMADPGIIFYHVLRDTHQRTRRGNRSFSL